MKEQLHDSCVAMSCCQVQRKIALQNSCYLKTSRSTAYPVKRTLHRAVLHDSGPSRSLAWPSRASLERPFESSSRTASGWPSAAASCRKVRCHVPSLVCKRHQYITHWATLGGNCSEYFLRVSQMGALDVALPACLVVVNRKQWMLLIVSLIKSCWVAITDLPQHYRFCCCKGQAVGLTLPATGDRLGPVSVSCLV